VKNKIVLITGSTDGIGKQTAIELARLGATVLLHGRSAERGKAAMEEVRRITGSDNLDYVAADLSSQKQVRAMAAQVHERYDRLHVLINNAAVVMNKRQLTEDGLEMTFAVNHLAPFLLTHLLLGLLQQSAPARIINVSSGTHQGARIDFDNLQGERSFNGYSVYALSKLGNILFTYDLAERLKGTGVTVNCLHPGVTATKLLRIGWGSGGDSLEEGAATPVYLASLPEVENVTGQYFVRKQPTPSSALTHDVKLRQAFWKVSEQLTGLA
jgi:NAD(P)-dependent dehydrogenase (short-subunit alcohol dehydrogenase family)